MPTDLPSPLTADVEIVSFGYLHGPPPSDMDLVLDLRRHFRDPHINPALRYLTALDDAVRSTVRTTPGIPELITATVTAVLAYRTGPSAALHPVRIASGCAGGRHRAGSVSLEIGDALTALGLRVTVTHRDLHRPVVDR